MKSSFKTLLGALAICTAASLWALEAIVLMPNLYNLPTLFVVFMLHLVPFVLMNFFFFRQYRYLHIIPLKDWFYFVLLALMGGILGTFFITKALFLLNFKQLTLVTLLQKLQPLFALILARILLGEKLQKRSWPWILLALLSSYVLTFGLKAPDFSESTAQSALLALCAAFCYGSQTVIGKKIIAQVPPLTGTFYRLGLTSLLLGVFFLFQRDDFWNYFTQITWKNAQIFLVIGLLSSGIGLNLYYFGLKRIKASVATICELSFVLSSVLLDYFVHGTILSALQWAAAGALLLAIYRISR